MKTGVKALESKRFPKDFSDDMQGCSGSESNKMWATDFVFDPCHAVLGSEYLGTVPGPRAGPIHWTGSRLASGKESFARHRDFREDPTPLPVRSRRGDGR